MTDTSDMKQALRNLKERRAERKQIRRIFSEAAGRIEELFATPGFVYDDDAAQLFEVTSSKAERLFTLEAEVGKLIFSCIEKEDEIQEEMDTTEVYRDRWNNILFLKNTHLKREIVPLVPTDCRDRDAVSLYSVNVKNRFSLPKLELKKFDGDIRHWLGFWSVFKKIYDDDDIDLDDKYQYLIQSTVDGSPARALVDSFPPCGENFEKAVQQLKSRFGREGLLIQLYIRELLALVLKQSSGSNLDLRFLYDQLVTQTRALESLGVARENYAYMLLPLVESALPEGILRLWERKRPIEDTSTTDSTKELDDLLDFVRREVEGQERLALAKKSFISCKGSEREPKKATTSPKGNIYTAADLINVKSEGKSVQCIFCSKNHDSESCFKARDLSVKEIEKIVVNKGRCFLCFRGNHSRKQCKIGAKCIICQGRHSTLLCPQRKIKNVEGSEVNESVEVVEKNLSAMCMQNIYLQTLLVIVRGKGECRMRLLIDTGSQRSYITQRVVSLLGYDSNGQEHLSHALFGGTTSKVQVHNQYKVRLMDVTRKYACNFDVLATETICNSVPVAAKGPWLDELQYKNISLSDIQEGPIDILVGADVAGKLLTGRREILKSGLVAVETLLGWCVMGQYKSKEPTGAMLSLSMLSTDISVSDLWRLDCLGIEDPVVVRTREEQAQYTREHFQETLKILPSGRYEVRLPWLPSPPVLHSNYDIAKNRLVSTCRKLNKLGLQKDYYEVFEEWLREGIIEELPYIDEKDGHYLPHRPVIKEGSTTRIRPVFDASARSNGCASLNQCLGKGENLIDLIPSILLRFRLNQVGVIADIRKAFLQISLAEEDRNMVQFLLMDLEGNLRGFRHTRVVFGVTSSPFLLGAVVDHHLGKCEELAHYKKYISHDTLVLLRKSFYVDNCIASLPCLKAAQTFVRESTEIFKLACFELRGWELSDSLLDKPHHTPLLGLLWERKEDIIQLSLPTWDSYNNLVVTRRIILSTVQRIFDPMGISAPATLIPKLWIQKTWTSGGEWDSEVDSDMKIKFVEWLQEVDCLKNLRVQRYFTGFNREGSTSSLHLFTDASHAAFAAVVFLRVEWFEQVKIFLVEAKTRVAPIKGVTIPRLELLGATIGARMVHRIQKDLGDVDLYCWSDAATVIAWITRDDSWGVFVFNRVKEIRELTPSTAWHHVPGKLNPADLLSRGCNPHFLVQSKWWEGPSWLYTPRDEWPSGPLQPDENEVFQELRKTAISNVNQNSIHLSRHFMRQFSTYPRVIRVLGWIFRFCENAKRGVRTRNPKETRVSGALNLEEFSNAERRMMKIAQSEMFDHHKDKRVKRLKPQVDQYGLVRIRTRIWARKDTDDFRAPILLAPEHELCKMLMMYVHRKNRHVGGHGLLTLLREKFWIIRGKQAVRRIVANCTICKRFTAKKLCQETPPLPEDRVREAAVFEVIGTDLAGPLYLRDGTKVWMVIFTCAIFRAVHLDLVPTLSADGFLLALRRFIARRGRPSIIYSDNGTNFKGTNKAMQNLDWEKIKAEYATEPIDWRFNPPSGPWWGGFFERMIAMVKVLLRKNLGRASLAYGELYTLICECEMLINSRPITYVSDDNEGPVPITPMMFLQEIRESGVPDLEAIDSASLDRRLQYRQKLKANLRLRFRAEYLSQLVDKNRGFKDTREPKEGEVVIVQAEGLKRQEWPLAVVETLFHGKDGKCRVVKLKTANGSLIRPIQRLYPLEVFSHPTIIVKEDTDASKVLPTSELFEDSSPIENGESSNNCEEQVKEVITRVGRKVKLPFKLR